MHWAPKKSYFECLLVMELAFCMRAQGFDSCLSCVDELQTSLKNPGLYVRNYLFLIFEVPARNTFCDLFTSTATSQHSKTGMQLAQLSCFGIFISCHLFDDFHWFAHRNLKMLSSKPSKQNQWSYWIGDKLATVYKTPWLIDTKWSND